MSRFVVTGAAGFIGSHLVEALVARGDEVVAVDAFTDYYDPQLKQQNAAGLDVLRLDLAEETLDLDGVDGVFHLAGQPGVRASWGADFGLYVRRNVLATQRLLEAAVPARVRVVFASSSSIYGDAEAYPTPEDTQPRPISPYGITKLACEHLLYAYRADAVALRYFTVYGPRQRPDMFFTRMLTALAEGSEFTLYGDGSASRSFTYVADAVDATIAAMERGRGVYNVGGGTETTVRDAIALAERISGRTLEVSRQEAQAGDVRRTRADTERIRADLGWEPRTPLEEGLRAQWEWASSRVAAR
jgi:nucleoside-diphosphate-sugar epimerase